MPDATFGAPGRPNGTSPDLSHAISNDGSRIFWSALDANLSPKALYVRENATRPQSPVNGQEECTVSEDACTIQLDKTLPGPGGARFWTASSDGSKVFFTKGNLYEYEVSSIAGRSGVLTDLTPGVEVQGVIGGSEDGSYVYYVNDVDELFVLHHNGDEWEAPVLIATLSQEEGEGVEPFAHDLLIEEPLVRLGTGWRTLVSVRLRWRLTDKAWCSCPSRA